MITTSTQHYQRLIEYVTPHWKMLALAFFSMTLMALTLSVLPVLILQLLDHTIANKNLKFLQLILLTIFVLFVVRGAMHFISNHAINSVFSALATNLRIAMFKKLLTLPDGYYTTHAENDVTARLITDINQLIHACTNVITILVKDSLTFIGLFAWMFYLNQELTLLALLVTALMVIIMQLTNSFINHASAKYIQKAKNVTNILLNVTKNYKTIRLHDSQLHESDHFTNNLEQMQDAHMVQISTQNLSIILTQIFVIIIFSAAGYLAIQQVYNNTTTLGAAGSFLLAALLLAIPLKQMLCIKKYIKQGQQSLDKIFAFLDQEIKVETGTVNIKRALGELVFDHVSYFGGSQTQPLLKNITFTINPGEIVAFVDASKNSKAAIIDLILCFCQPSSGNIRLDGHDLTDLKSTSLYSNIAFLPKNVPLIDDTVAANIAYGEMRCAIEAKITAAAQASNAMTFIRKMSQGLQTQLGGQGTKLSKKQRQHIGIARAMLKDAPILILDGIPTNSVTEPDDLQDALQILMQGRTTLIFCQHPSIIKKANRVYILENGYITELDSD